jgi:hypothetical protein
MYIFIGHAPTEMYIRMESVAQSTTATLFVD